MTHSRPIDRSAARASKPARTKKLKPRPSGPTLSRTALNPAAAWPFPAAPEPAAEPVRGLRYIDAKGVERVYSFRKGRS